MNNLTIIPPPVSVGCIIHSFLYRGSNNTLTRIFVFDVLLFGLTMSGRLLPPVLTSQMIFTFLAELLMPVEWLGHGSRNHHLIKWKPVQCQTLTSWMKPSVCFYFVLKYWWWIIASLTCVIGTLDGEILCFSVSQWSHPSSINILRFYFSEVSKHPRYMKHFRGSGGWAPLTA